MIDLKTTDPGRIEALAREGALIAYFGYGSLVNRATLRTNVVGAGRARLKGWRREWQGRGTRRRGVCRPGRSIS